jgi:hypothetical protein
VAHMSAWTRPTVFHNCITLEESGCINVVSGKPNTIPGVLEHALLVMRVQNTDRRSASQGRNRTG